MRSRPETSIIDGASDLAHDGFLPRAFAAVHPRYRSPQAAILVQSLITLALAISGTFEKLAILANVSALALYLGCALAAWRLRRLGVSGDSSRTSPYRRTPHEKLRRADGSSSKISKT